MFRQKRLSKILLISIVLLNIFCTVLNAQEFPREYKYTLGQDMKLSTAVARILFTKYKIIPKRIITAGRCAFMPINDNKKGGSFKQ